MVRHGWILAGFAAASVTACATAPADVPALAPYVRPATYEGLDCDQQRQEAVKISDRVHDILSRDNKGRRSPIAKDKGLISPWIASYYVDSGPAKDELLRLNDAYRALADVATGAGCPVAGDMLTAF